MFPVRYEHHLLIKKKSRPRNGLLGLMLSVRYEHHIHMKNKAISVTGRGGL
jgi:hypothetical protein